MARNGSANAFSNMLILSKILSKQQKIYKPYELLPSHSLFFKFNPFWVNVPRKFRNFCVLGEHVETSQFILQIKSGGWFSMGHMISRDIRLWWNIGLNLANVFVTKARNTE